MYCHSAKLLVACLVTVFCSVSAYAKTGGITMTALVELANSDASTRFAFFRNNPSFGNVQRTVMSYEPDGLRQYALVLRPGGTPPDGGWPVVQFNHGFHPDPPKSGFVASGQSDRPGDYYRALVQAYAKRGFVVVAPDYRGHNVSEGGAFTSRVLADAWYTRDAITAFLAIESLDDVNLQRVYMTGHSMGGLVTQRALIALGNRVQAASIWSTAGGQYLPAMLLRELMVADGTDDNAQYKAGFSDLRNELAQEGEDVCLEQVTPAQSLDNLEVPLSIQHSAGDITTFVTGSLSVAAALYQSNKTYQLKVYPSQEHLFAGEDFEAAVERDVAWFNRFQ
jgi:uncharacterized protein